MLQLPQMRAFLHFVLDPAMGCMEMRVFHATFDRGLVRTAQQYSKTLAGWYDDPHSLVVDAGRLRDVSAFVTLNPVRDDLLARSNNELTKAKHTTSDDDVVCLRWLYVDIDPVRPADISSTEDELKRAVERREKILDDGIGFGGATLWGCSGNGAWILARMPDMDNTDANRKSVGKILADLSARYSDDRVKIDTTTKNPSRVMCLPGTLKCKGSNVPSRPHRQVTFVGHRGGGDAGGGGSVPKFGRPPVSAPHHAPNHVPKLNIVRAVDVA